MSRFRKVLVPVALAAVVLIAPTRSQAEESYGQRLLDKASHGLSNVVLGWGELPKNVVNISSDCSFLAGMTWGVVRGAVHAASRTVVGAAEFVTSPIPTEDYVTPPYIWDRLSEDTRYFGIHLPGEWTHFGPLDDGGFGER
jgi:putative exosortase-associated protein (TIGR04073 family)